MSAEDATTQQIQQQLAEWLQSLERTALENYQPALDMGLTSIRIDALQYLVFGLIGFVILLFGLFCLRYAARKFTSD